jgi:hypothetical protein
VPKAVISPTVAGITSTISRKTDRHDAKSSCRSTFSPAVNTAISSASSATLLTSSASPIGSSGSMPNTWRPTAAIRPRPR